MRPQNNKKSNAERDMMINLQVNPIEDGNMPSNNHNQGYIYTSELDNVTSGYDDAYTSKITSIVSEKTRTGNSIFYKVTVEYSIVDNGDLIPAGPTGFFGSNLYKSGDPFIIDDNCGNTVNGYVVSIISKDNGNTLWPDESYVYELLVSVISGDMSAVILCLENQVQTPETPEIADVTTNLITSISNTTSISGGDVTSDGGANVTSRGVCWSTSSNPTILDSKTINGTGTGVFTSSLTGLLPLTTYYVRSYATNSIGTAYGNERSFISLNNTQLCDNPDITIVMPWYAGGNKTWISCNLDVETYSDGTPIPEVNNVTQWRNLTTGAWCYNKGYGSNPSLYGKLYNWYAVQGIWNEESKTDLSARKQLAPDGYHVPTVPEMSLLITTTLGGESTAGGKMKKLGFRPVASNGVFNSNDPNWINPNTGATPSTSSGWEGLPGGYRTTNNIASDIGYSGWWWTSYSALNVGSVNTFQLISYFSMKHNTAAITFSNTGGGGVVLPYAGGTILNYGMSVRLIKDY